MKKDRHLLFDFDAVAERYDSWYDTVDGREHDIAQKAAVFKLLPACDPGDRLLDVGCGTGHWSRFFARRGYEVLGIDIAPKMVELARSQPHPRCRFETADVHSLSKQHRNYRVVAAMTVLEFVDDAAGMLELMARRLKYAGTILIGALNRLASLNRARVESKKEPYASAKLLSPEELGGLLSPYGRVEMAGADPQRSPRLVAFEHDLDNSPFIVAAATADIGHPVIRPSGH